MVYQSYLTRKVDQERTELLLRQLDKLEKAA